MSRRRWLIAAAIGLGCTAAAPAEAWGIKGHQWTVSDAIELLPEEGCEPLRQLMEARRHDLTFRVLYPDFQWQDGSLGSLEGPNHYVDLEVLAPGASKATPVYDWRPQPDDIPRTRLDAGRLYTDRGFAYSEGGFLPWRIEELYEALVNAMKTEAEPDSRSSRVLLLAGALAHYAGDATQPLHTTIHYDGRVDRVEDGVKELASLHLDYETSYLEEQGLEFRAASLALAGPAEELDDAFVEVCELLCDSHACLPQLYDTARRHQGEGRFEAWDREIGEVTRGRLARASTLIASLWLTAWIEAGCPEW